MNPPTRSRRGEGFRFGRPGEHPNGSRSAAFTLVELLVVLAMMAIWAMLLVPALARTQPDSRAARCLNNHRQLCRAWIMYASDSNDKLATSGLGSFPSPPSQPMWAAGWLDWAASTDNTNSLYLTDPRYSILAQYCGKDARLFKCPADQYISTVQRVRGLKERVRSISQNMYAANWNVGSGLPTDPAYAQVTKLTELLNPKPAETWVSIDEHPDSINDGVLVGPTATYWYDQPASYHDGGASVAFADGHTEMHRWQGSLLKIPIIFTFTSVNVPATDPDILWVRYHTPHKPGAN